MPLRILKYTVLLLLVLVCLLFLRFLLQYDSLLSQSKIEIEIPVRYKFTVRTLNFYGLWAWVVYAATLVLLLPAVILHVINSLRPSPIPDPPELPESSEANANDYKAHFAEWENYRRKYGRSRKYNKFAIRSMVAYFFILIGSGFLQFFFEELLK